MTVPSLLLGLWLALLAPSLVFAADFHGKVVGVADGDTITVLHDGKSQRVRLQGIDCPEQGQAFGQRAKQATSRLVFGQVVTVRAVGKDRFGRTLGEVLLPFLGEGELRTRIASHGRGVAVLVRWGLPDGAARAAALPRGAVPRRGRYVD